jgi:hypothetical protein
MDENERAAWEKTRARGAWRFVLPFVLLVGVLPSLSLLVMDYFRGRWPFVADELWREEIWFWAVAAFVQLLLGVLVGYVAWFSAERRYKKHAGGRVAGLRDGAGRA